MATTNTIAKLAQAAANVASTPKALEPKAESKPAAPKGKAKGKAESKPAAKPAEPKAKGKEEFDIHINNTGRICFGVDEAARIEGYDYCSIAVDVAKKLIRLEPARKQAEGAKEIKYADKEYKIRPYISATREMKPLGFDGSRPYDCIAKPYGAAGFEFKLA